MSLKKPVKKGLSSSLQTTDRANATHAQETSSVDPNAGKRPPRVSMTKGQNLGLAYGIVLDEENYHYHWIAEHPLRPGKLQEALAAWYEHVTDKEGRPVQRPSGAGTMYLMRLPMEYWKEDLAEKKRLSEETMDKELLLGPNEYAPTADGKPEGGESALIKRTVSNNIFSEGKANPYVS